MEHKERFLHLLHYAITKKDYVRIGIGRDDEEIWLSNTWNKEYGYLCVRQDETADKESFENNLDILVRRVKYLSEYTSKPHTKVLYLDFSKGVRPWSSVAEHPSEKIDGFVFDWEEDRFVPDPPPLLQDWLKQYEVPRPWKEYAKEIDGVFQRNEDEINILQNRTHVIWAYLFIAINVMLFLLMEWAGGSENTRTLLRFGAIYGPYIAQGQVWRLFASMFLHIGLNHLFVNMFSMYMIGSLVNQVYGKRASPLIYIMAGIAGSVLSFSLSNPNALYAGASGAIFGLIGSLLYIAILDRGMFRRIMGRSVIVLVVINLLYGFLAGGIDNFGHIGGLLGGFLAAGIFGLPKKQKRGQKIICAVALLVFLTLFYLIGLNRYLPYFQHV